MWKRLIDINVLIICIVAFIAAVANLFMRILWLNVLIQITIVFTLLWNWYRMKTHSDELFQDKLELTWRIQIAERLLNDLEFDSKEKGRVALAGKVAQIRDILMGEADECEEM